MNVTARLRELDEAILARRAQNTIDSGQRAAPRPQDRLTQVNPNRRNGRIIRSQGRAKVNHMKNETVTRNAPASVVVTASSAGGMRALSTILSRLPPNFPAALIAVQHRAPGPPYLLSEILRKRTHLDVKDAIEGDTLARGTVYLARPESHLVVRGDGTLGYTDVTRIRFLRSAADPLFDSASKVFGGELTAVVLTGGDSDAMDGVRAVKKNGGYVIAQDPDTSDVDQMPRSAIETGCVDRVLPLHEIADALVERVKKHTHTQWLHSS